MKELRWNLDSARVEILFPYDKKLVDLVRDLPGRRWHPDEKCWSVPRESIGEVAHRLLPLGFVPSDEVRGFLEDPEAIAAAPPPSAPPAADAPRAKGGASSGSTSSAIADRVSDRPATSAAVEGDTWSISALNERVRSILKRGLPGTFWVVGEVVGFDRNAHKRHVFFSLAEKEEGDDAPRATVTAVLFDRTRAMVEKTLALAGGGLAFQDGVRVRLEVSVDLYPKNGSYQLIVESIDPTFTLGEIALRQERILRQVRDAGLAERNLALPFPVPPLRIGLITSHGSDAYNDFLSELKRSGYSFEVSVLDVHVQGERLEKDVLRALDHFAAVARSVDVLVITRGGGSRTDLMGFDTPDLAFAVARHPVKIVIGIGHQQDRSVLDAIAHSEKTPTAAAAHLVTLCREAEDRLRRDAERLGHTLARTIHRERSRAALWGERARGVTRARLSAEAARIGRARSALPVSSGRALRDERRRLTETRAEFPRAVRRSLRGARERVHEGALRLSAKLSARLVTARERLARDRDRLPRSAARAIERAGDRLSRAGGELPRRSGHALREARTALATLEERVRARDPQAVLARGYAWLRRPDGRTVASVTGVFEGDAILARLADGTIDARVEAVRKGEAGDAPGEGAAE